MKHLLLIALPVALMACNRTAPPREAEAAVPSVSAIAPATSESAPGAGADTALLAGFHWQLQDARNAQGQRIDALRVRQNVPVTLDFEDDRIGVSGTCNRMGGRYAIDGGTLRIETLTSTMMACADERVMALDREVGKRLEGNVQLALQRGNAPTLTLTTASGDVLSFTGQPTVETQYGGPGERMFLEVAADTRPCSHPLIPDKQCLQVREITYDDNGIKSRTGDWGHFYDDIQGYTHEDGIRNVLRVKRFKRNPAPADASTNVYVLDMVVESERVER